MSIPNTTPQTHKGLRLHIGIFGRRNAGKSTLMNALTGQSLSIVSDTPGTTTDPVEKAYELHPIGPVVFIDTAGVDDIGELGAMRVAKSHSLLKWMDLAIIVVHAKGLEEDDRLLLKTVQIQKTPAIVVINQIDTVQPETLDALHTEISELIKAPVTDAALRLGIGVEDIRTAIVNIAQNQTEPDLPMMGELVKPGDHIILVTPIDTGAPKGRLIMPQVQAIREILDADAICTVVRENRLTDALNNAQTPPKFVITDSQVVKSVCANTPSSIPVTTFSIQMAYSKCDLVEMARGAAMLNFLKPGDKIMVCETCSHHPQADDIGRLKIPRWLSTKIGGPLKVDVVVGKNFPTDLSQYKLILQCGGCIVTRRHMLARLAQAKAQNVPMTNYGVAISYLQGVLERALEVHPEAMAAYRHALLEYNRSQQ